jgi:hypothetical protein
MTEIEFILAVIAIVGWVCALYLHKKMRFFMEFMYAVCNDAKVREDFLRHYEDHKHTV